VLFVCKNSGGEGVDATPQCGPASTSRAIIQSVKVRDLVHLLESAGWTLKATRGSHRQFLHPRKGMVVTVPGHPGKDVPIGTLKAILRSAGLERIHEQ
jgi:predicted RNA binding protein YcfA (HicA-like mRNA interferase family)